MLIPNDSNDRNLKKSVNKLQTLDKSGSKATFVNLTSKTILVNFLVYMCLSKMFTILCLNIADKRIWSKMPISNFYRIIERGLLDKFKFFIYPILR